MTATAITHTTRISFSTGSGGSTISGTVTRTGDAEDNRLVLVAPLASDEEVDIAIDVSALKSLIILADGDLTVHVNTGGGTELAVAAGVPVLYWADANMTNPLGVSDVTKLLVTNGSSTATVRLDVKVLQDATPGV